MIHRLAVWAALSLAASAQDTPSVTLRDAPLIQMPGVEVPSRGLQHDCDSNSPLHWDRDTLYVFNSYDHSWRSSGPDLSHLGGRVSVNMPGHNQKLPIRIESTWKDEDGTLYGAYHYEPDLICFSNRHLPTMPRIGWIRSADNGATWEDLGFVIEAKPCAIKCDTESPWDAGGTGDFSFIPDERREYVYFFVTSYDPDPSQQGVFVARMRYADRNDPTGKVMKWHNGAWSELGLWGSLTPVFASERDYHRADGAMFWGPAVHWNTYLKMYVMLLNHAIDTRLDSSGIFVSFNARLDDPKGWTEPTMILDYEGIRAAMAGASVSESKLKNGWYPQVIGAMKGETDKIAGRTARFFMAGVSRKEIVFQKPSEKAR